MNRSFLPSTKRHVQQMGSDMKGLQLLTRWIPMVGLALTLSAVACSTGSGNNVTPDTAADAREEPDYGPLPDVPPVEFELRTDLRIDQDLPDGYVLPDIDGYVFEIIGQDTKPEVVGPLPDGNCIPDCFRQDGSKKACGPDGCGSICGYCSFETQCVVDECKEVCIPKCDGKECGSDGCYGECPPGCDPGFACGEDFKCYPNCDHDGFCATRQCGPDGCGGSCGSCGLGTLCNNDTGMCQTDPCVGIPVDTGKCTDGVLYQCVNGQPLETVCSSMGADYFCKFDPIAQKYVCSQGCVPSCSWDDGTPKECGYDGCYGVCGTCPSGWTCNAGKCYPQPGSECGWLTDVGECFGNILWYCAGGQLMVEYCDQMGLKCLFEPTVMQFRCK